MYSILPFFLFKYIQIPIIRNIQIAVNRFGTNFHILKKFIFLPSILVITSINTNGIIINITDL